MTPDRITGTWKEGTFDISRLWNDIGRYRFIGEFTGTIEDGIVPGGVITFNLNEDDSNIISGEAFEITEGLSFQVTGSVTGDVLQLTATGKSETFNATAKTVGDLQNQPTGVTDSIAEGGGVSFVSCRLN